MSFCAVELISGSPRATNRARTKVHSPDLVVRAGAHIGGLTYLWAGSDSRGRQYAQRARDAPGEAHPGRPGSLPGLRSRGRIRPKTS